MAVNFEIFTQKRIRYLEQKYQCNFPMYMKNEENETVVLRQPMIMKHPKTVYLMMAGPLPETKNGQMENFQLINDETLLPRLYVCEKTKGCKYSTYRTHNFERHQAICGISNVKKIRCKQQSYGNNYDTLKEMADKFIVPVEALSYRNNILATFDLETIEEPLISCAPKIGKITFSIVQKGFQMIL